MSMGQLAGHLTEMVGWDHDVTTDSLDMNPGDRKPFIPKTQEELLSTFDQNLATLRSTLASMSDGDMMKRMEHEIGGNVLFAMPRVGVMRTMIMNHIIHHRAQLTVYYHPERRAGARSVRTFGGRRQHGRVGLGLRIPRGNRSVRTALLESSQEGV